MRVAEKSAGREGVQLMLGKYGFTELIIPQRIQSIKEIVNLLSRFRLPKR